MQRWPGLLTALFVCGTTMLGSAPAAAADPDDAPPLIAGRVAAVEGEVSIWRAEEDGGGEWDAAQINDVVTTGTSVATGDGRAEMRIGPHAFRLGTGSSGGFSQLDLDSKLFGLERGTVNVRLAPAQGENVALLVADVRIDVAAPGRYRVDAIDGTPLGITVFEGQASVRYGAGNVAVSAGQMLQLTQSSTFFAAASVTALDDWAFARDARYAQARSASYVSPNMTGYEDLDAHGEWIADATYGTVWTPRAVPVGWAPYRDGRWRWVAPWGWTWVDAAPWGYAPFHYGRWVTIGSRWCWWPGGYVARPVWAPALVGFVGTTGAALPFGAGGPVVGWYPLAPWHAYRPHYRANPRYVTIINQTIITRPPRGVPPDVNHHPGSTWVPGTRFRDPVVKVRIPAQTEKVADLHPMAPPPRPVRTIARSDTTHVPPAHPMPAPVRGGQNVVQAAPKFTISPPQPLPGADTTLSQPAPIRRVEPRPQPAPQPLPEAQAPRPKPNFPQVTVPPYQQLQKPFGAEPARTPPAAPPTVRQPSPIAAPSASQGVAAPPTAARAPASPPVARHAPGAGSPQRSGAVAAPAAPAPQPQPVAPPQQAAPTQHAAPPLRAAPVQQPAQTSKQEALQGARDDDRGKPGPDVPRSKTMPR